MSLTEDITFDKDGHIERFPLFRKLFLALVIILTAALSFGIGRLTVVGNREPIRIEYDASMTNDQILMTKQVSISKSQTDGEVITSKNGSKYHYPHCPGAKQIKEENKVIFTSANAAEAAGYTLASNCKSR